MKKRLLNTLLCLCMIAAIVSATALAANAEAIFGGKTTADKTGSAGKIGGDPLIAFADSTGVPTSPPPSDSGDDSEPLVTEIRSGESTTDNNLSMLVAHRMKFTVVGDDGAKLVFSPDALKGITKEVTGIIKFEINDISGTMQNELPGKRVYQLKVTSAGKTVASFGGSVTVSFPYALKDGEKADDVIVWYRADDGSMTKVPCAYDEKTGVAVCTVEHFSEYVVGTEWVNAFEDVSEDDWFFEDVAFVNEAGFMRGDGSGFDPHGMTTRAMIVTILYRLEGEPTIMFIREPDKVFSDVEDGAWYEKAVQWAQLNGIVNGFEDATFRPNDFITREQLAAILYRYAQYKGCDVSPAMGMAGYEDASEVSEYAVSAMQWACASGLINGSDGKLMPQGGAERCQAAAILHRFCENILK